MLHQPEPNEQSQAVRAGQNLSHWRAPETGNRLDCETGILLRRTLALVFTNASCWQTLQSKLNERGFGLGFRDGRLMLTDINNETFICSCRFLGWPLPDLVSRFGKIRARTETHSNRARIVG